MSKATGSWYSDMAKRIWETRRSINGGLVGMRNERNRRMAETNVAFLIGLDPYEISDSDRKKIARMYEEARPKTIPDFGESIIYGTPGKQPRGNFYNLYKNMP